MPFINRPGHAASVFTVKTSHYLIAGMSIVVALNWNKTIETSLNETFPLPGESMKTRIIYSIVLTAVLILVIMCLPDTKAELPLDTQHRLYQAEMYDHKLLMEQNKLVIATLQRELLSHQ